MSDKQLLIRKASERVATTLLYHLHNGGLWESALEHYNDDTDDDIVDVLGKAIAILAREIEAEEQ